VGSPERRRAASAIISGIAIAALSACSNADARQSKSTIRPTYDKQTGKLIELAYDSNHDGRPDTWTDMDGTKPLRTRIDRNRAGPDGKGILVRAEEDTKGDGKPHKWETYRDGALDTVAFDEDGDGVPDRRFTYRASALVLIESHPDSSGRFTVRTQIHR